MRIASFLLAISISLLSRAHAERPDILMIAIDDLRPMLGCYGDERIQTPNIDRLAKRSVLFERAYCQYAKCGTSRLSLMTGLRPDAMGVFSNNVRDVNAFRKRKPAAQNMAAWFKEQGYDVRGYGKILHDGWDQADDWSTPPFPGREREMWEVVDPNQPQAPTHIAERTACPVMQGPDVPDNHLFAGRMTDKVLSLIRTDTGKQPRFLAVGYRRPHLPFVAPKRYYDLYQPDANWLARPSIPSRNAPIMAWFNSDGYGGMAKRQADIPMPQTPTREEAIAWNGYEMRSYLGVPTHGNIKQSLQLDLLHAYAACVSYVDAQIGRLLEGLEASGRSKRTIIVLWSDHGWHLGEHSAWGKMTNYEIATRVPFMIAAPGLASGRTRSLAELVDLYPTLCELANIPAPGHLEGESLVPVLHKPKQSDPGIALSQYARYGTRYMGRAIRTDRYRFVTWTEKKTGEVIARELYDHQEDPAETQNLAMDQAQASLLEQLEVQAREAFQ